MLALLGMLEAEEGDNPLVCFCFSFIFKYCKELRKTQHVGPTQHAGSRGRRQPIGAFLF